MAVASKRKKGSSIPKDENGDPDIYTLVNEREMSIIQACETADVGIAKGHRLLWAQEVMHNPDLEISTKGPRERLAKKLYRERTVNKVRWERLVARTGLTKKDVMDLIREGAELEGDDPDAVISRKANALSAEEAAEKAKKGKKAKKALAESGPDDEDEDEDDEDLEDEDEDEDDEDEDEAPVAVKSRPRGKARRK
jgi:hypothetical protein